MTTLNVQLFGSPTIEWQGNYFEIPRRRARALLYRLAVDLQPVAREHLVFLFWSDTADSIAHRDLSHLLTHLRRALPSPEMLQATSDFIFLNPKLVWSDTYAFHVLFCKPHAFELPDVLEQAASLFGGPFMDGFVLDDCPEFEEWVTLERSVWERRHFSLLNTIVKQQIAVHNLPKAIDYAEQYLDAEPMEPEMHRRLIELHLNNGDDDLIARQYAACADLLEQHHILGKMPHQGVIPTAR